jgi:long-chain-fatty-acyl-CoA reductase
MKKFVDLPKIICGEEIFPSADTESVQIAYASGTVVRIPKVTDADFERIAAHRELLDAIPISEVTSYLHRGGAPFANLDDALVAEAASLCHDTTGFSKEMVERDYKLIGGYLFHRSILYDLLDAELGDHRMLDEWVRQQVARIRAFPRGRVFHVVAGNVPLSSMYSLVRSVLTKNHTVIKLPSRDMVSCLYFARSLIANNPAGHPLSKAISVVYCDAQDPMFDRFIDSSDLVCGWGQGESLRNIKQKLPQGVPMLEFGPKRSLSLIYADECDPDKAAMRIAHDVAVYDQEACFSPQRLFVIGDHVPLVAAICNWLDTQETFYPKGRITQDADSHVLRTRLEGIYRENTVKSGASWTIIVSDDPQAMLDHPLSRTLFVHPIAAIDDIVPFVDDETQSISLYPYAAHAEELGNLLCARGVVRICEAGMISHFRQGFTHDGCYPLRHFVRLAYLDETLEYVYKYGNPSVAQYEVRLFGAHAAGAAA